MKIASALPKGDANGLGHYSSELVKALAKGGKFLVVGVVTTASVQTKEDLDPVPTVRLVRVEMIPDGDKLEKIAAQMLSDLRALRTTGAGQQQFDLRDEAEAEVGPREIESGAGIHFKVVDVEPGVFELWLCSRYVDGLLVRRLPRGVWGEVPPGEYQASQFDEGLRSLAEALVRDWESNAGASTTNDVVDAEIVDEDAEGGESA